MCRLFLVLALAAAVAAGCLRNPVTNKRQTRLLSEASERAIGAETRDELVKQYGEVKDASVRAYVSRVGLRVAAVSDRPRLEYVYTVLDTEVVNAFAAPGGFIFVTRGLLERTESEAELATVLGHETGHVCAWHGVIAIQHEMGAGILTLLGTVAAGVAAGPEAAVAMLQTAGLFSDLYLLGYGRENEIQADQLGLRYALSAGYDAQAALTFFQRLEKLEAQAGADEWEPYLRSHPPTETRIALAKAYLGRMEEFRRPTPETAGDFSAVKDRLVRGEAKDMGRVEGRRFVHPSLGVSLEIPAGWSWEIHNQEVLAGFQSPAGGAEGELRRRHLGEPMKAEEFARAYSLERRWKLLRGREVVYPAGYGWLGFFEGEGTMGDGYEWRVLFITRGRTGWALACAAPGEKVTDFLLPFEGILRSFQLTGVADDGGDKAGVESDLRVPALQRTGRDRKDPGGDSGGRDRRRVRRGGGRNPGVPPDDGGPPGGQSPSP
jgi:Zn-dependent protease with chaperone function